MIRLPETKTAELSTYGNFAKCHQAHFRVSHVGLGTRLTGPHASSIAENSNCTSCKNKLYFKTVLSYVSGLWTAALELQELHKDIVSTQTLTRLLHTTQGIHILLELPYKFRGNSSSCNRRQGNKYVFFC